MKQQITYLQNLFSSNDVSRIQNKSKNILNIFSQTVENLKKVNLEIDKCVSDRTDKINKMLDENKSFNTQLKENSKVIDKITEFLK